jgi:predicted transcriptional regulator
LHRQSCALFSAFKQTRWEIAMADGGRVLTTKVPEDLISMLDEVAVRLQRSKSWIVRDALSQWLADEQHRYQLTLEALKDVDEGRVFAHDDVVAGRSRPL